MVEAVQMGFNPHPLRGAGATLSLRAIRSASSRFQSSPAPRSGCNETPLKRSELVVHVSILTRSEERVQRHSWRRIEFESMFQSSPAPRSGCNYLPAIDAAERRHVSILTRSEERVQLFSHESMNANATFQSSPAPRSGCNRCRRACHCGKTRFNPPPLRGAGATTDARMVRVSINVSILTRSEERVQLVCAVISGRAFYVSILTRSEERVQQEFQPHRLSFRCFNPHPLRGAGATSRHAGIVLLDEGFNPHPLRGAGATGRRRRQTRCGSRFNPHPLRGAGATTRITPNYCARNVSILTRSEERVQLFMAMLRRLKGNVSILTRSEERVQPAGQLRRALGQRVSINLRSEERVQPLTDAKAVDILVFQSSPAPRSGCNATAGGASSSRACFNPHPLRGAGATCARPAARAGGAGFNPHPPRGAGATPGCWCGIRSRKSFNPHPLRGAGATGGSIDTRGPTGSFNPHPLRGAGATIESRATAGSSIVSILTRSEERVQPRPTRLTGA